MKLKNCKQCNAPFEPKSANHIFCSKPCKHKSWSPRLRKYENGKRVEDRELRPTKDCRNCGKPFKWFGRQVHCSEECYETYHQKLHKEAVRTVWGDKLPISMQGPLSEMAVAQDLFSKAWYVFRSIGASCPFDLIAYKDGQCVKIEVKTGRRWNDDKYYHTYVKNFQHDVLATYLKNTDEVIYKPPLP